jgi:hypothetical protein
VEEREGAVPRDLRLRGVVDLGPGIVHERVLGVVKGDLDRLALVLEPLFERRRCGR